MSKFLQYGGQAVIEGVMMRSPRFFAIACRKPDGAIVVQSEPVDKSFVGKVKFLNRPFLRGTFALIDAMALGMRALAFSASVQTEGLEDATKDGVAKGKKTGAHISDIAIGATMVMSFLVGTALFVALPTLLTQLLQNWLGVHNPIALNLVDGVIRIAIFVAYVALVSRMPNVRRVFEYHGAEHKSINTLEEQGPLTVDGCLPASRIHPRCGTSFVIIVLLLSVLVHSLFPRPPVYLVRVALHTALIPVVAGLAYETIRLAGKLRNASTLRIVLAPGLWTQRLTTREPDASQVEVALAALRCVLELEGELPATDSGSSEPPESALAPTPAA